MRTRSRASTPAAQRGCTPRSSRASRTPTASLAIPTATSTRRSSGPSIELLKTPVVDGDVALASKSVAYEFADPRLQSLSSAQRQFLRMGPRNVRLIQAKLREIAPLVGIPAESLPARVQAASLPRGC